MIDTDAFITPTGALNTYPRDLAAAVGADEHGNGSVWVCDDRVVAFYICRRQNGIWCYLTKTGRVAWPR